MWHVTQLGREHFSACMRTVLTSLYRKHTEILHAFSSASRLESQCRTTYKQFRNM